MKPSEIGGSKKSRFSKYTKIKYNNAEQPGSCEVGDFDMDTSGAGHCGEWEVEDGLRRLLSASSGAPVEGEGKISYFNCSSAF